MPLTDSLKVFSEYLESLLNTNGGPLGLATQPDGTPAVYYGDQSRIPVTPTACVDPGEKRQTLNGAPRRVEINFTTYILLYHNPVKGVETLTKESDAIAEAIEDVIHTDAQMGGIVVHSLVSVIEYGYQTRGNTLYRVSRLTVEGRSQVQLPSSV
jgi:hypothetical protein